MRTWIVLLLWACAHQTVNAVALSRGLVQRKTKEIEGQQDKELLKRSKRGWMWKQFFLQEEYLGTDHQYIGKVRDHASISGCKGGLSNAGVMLMESIAEIDLVSSLLLILSSEVNKQRVIQTAAKTYVGISSTEPAGFEIRSRVKSDLLGTSHSI